MTPRGALGKGTSNRYATAKQRESAKLLRDEGYEEVGWKQGSHLVMMHPLMGRMEVPLKTPPHIVLANAKRKERMLNNKANQVIDWIQGQQGVPPDGEKIVEGSLNRWIEEAQKTLGGEIQATNTNSLLESIRKNSRMEVLTRAQAGRGTLTPGQYRMRGRFWVAPDELHQPPLVDEDELLEPEATRPEIPRDPRKKPGRKSKVDLVIAQGMLDANRTPREIGTYFSVSKEQIYNLIRQGRLFRTHPGQRRNHGIRTVEGETAGFHSIPAIETRNGEVVNPKDGMTDTEAADAFYEAIEEMRPGMKTEEPIVSNEGLGVLGEYLGMKERAETAETKMELTQMELVELQRLVVARSALMIEMNTIDVKINEMLDSLQQL